ncbi:AAA family ATPase [Tardisphaera miroshnichenkoae]
MRVLALTGLPGAGKSTVSSLAEAQGLPVVSMGDAVREELRRRNLEPTPENFNSLTIGLRREYGDVAIAVLTLELIRKRGYLGAPELVVDGVRSLAEVEHMKGWPQVESVKVLAVLASFRDRFVRLYGRGREGDPKTENDLRNRDAAELSVGLGNLIALADVFLVNEGDMEAFAQKANFKLRMWMDQKDP